MAGLRNIAHLHGDMEGGQIPRVQRARGGVHKILKRFPSSHVILSVARHRPTRYTEKTTQVIHSQNVKLKYTGTPRARHSRPTHRRSGNADETYAGARPASRMGNSAAPASKPAWIQGPRGKPRRRSQTLCS